MVEKSNNLKSKTQSHNSSITDHSQIHQSHCYSQDRIIRLEEKVKMRGARVIESFTISTKGKSPEKLEHDTEVIIEMKDLRMY